MRYLLIALMLSGCAARVDGFTKTAEACEKLGYTKETDQFRDCQVKFFQMEQSRRNALIMSN